MDSITLENYRCFRKKQTARLAPLTLLVGNNSTGKTSFLAIVRALWDAVFRNEVPDFREEPYDLGTFGDISHNRSGRGGQAESFSAGFTRQQLMPSSRESNPVTFQLEFQEWNARPFPALQVTSTEHTRFAVVRREDESHQFSFSTWDGEDFEPKFEEVAKFQAGPSEGIRLSSLSDWMLLIGFRQAVPSRPEDARQIESPSAKDSTMAARLPTVDNLDELRAAEVSYSFIRRPRPFASAPIRSRPRRTYDPTRISHDSGGEDVPSYLATLYTYDKEEWTRLKEALEAFGQASGLFDDIDISLLGKDGGAPFQVQIRKFGRRLKGPKRNLIDVGYGVSQALPLLTELLREDAPSMFLLQQPEVHLHPSAQAALGSLFCNTAGPERQLIVETHSDYILNRVRMDIRDKKTNLKPEDVSILYFEPGELEVTIHSLGLDKNGNVLDAPPGYRQFFMTEMRRSIGI